MSISLDPLMPDGYSNHQESWEPGSGNSMFGAGRKSGDESPHSKERLED
jgi:hypothetical protein